MSPTVSPGGPAGSRRRVLPAFLAVLLAAPAVGRAGEAPADGVEFPVWSRSYVGTLGSRTVEVQLERVADLLRGSYCYAPCTEASRWRLYLRGRAVDGGAVLSEEDAGAARTEAAATGHWELDAIDGLPHGAWRSPDGRRVLPLALTPVAPDDAPPFPFEIRLVADALPDDTQGCGNVPTVTGIRLYRDGERVQALETESTGSCGIFTPEIVDMDFDGWPDIAIAQFLPAGPNIPMDAWLYDPATGRFARAPASLLQVTTPNFDAARRLVWHTWRDGCCRHGVDIFRWRDGELEHVDGDESYMMPVRVDGELRECYVAPDYADGRIVWQGALRDVAGRPTLDPDVAAHCTPTTPEGMLDPSRIRIDVWQEAAPGSAPIRIRSETARTVQGVVGDTTRTCTELPVFDEGTIGWLPLAGDGCASPDDP